MPPPTSPSTPRSQRGDPGAIALGLGALLLFISLFLHWYQPGRSAWRVFEVWDLVLAALAVTAMTAALGRLALAPARSDRWMIAPSAASFVIVLVSLLNHPPAAIGAGPMVGIWLALAATIVMIAGTASSLAQVSLVVEFAHRPPAARDGAPLPRPHLRRRRPDASAPAHPSPSPGVPASPGAGVPANPSAGPGAPASPSPAPAAPSGPSPTPFPAPETAGDAESDTAIRPVAPSDPDTQPTQTHTRPPDDPEAPRPDPTPE